MNQVQLLGRITHEPELRQSASGANYLFLSLAVPRNKEKTDFPEVVFFGKSAEFVSKYFAKGDYIAISAHIETDSYDKNGERIYTQKIVADRAEFAGYKKGNQDTAAQNDFLPGAVSDDDLPF